MNHDTESKLLKNINHDTLLERIRNDINKNISDANSWLKHEKNSPEYVKTSYVYGICYRYGMIGKEKDLERSIYYFKQAGEQGHAGACYNLARLYLYGDDVDEDLDQAKYYAGKPIETESYDTEYYRQERYVEMVEAIRRVIDDVKSGKIRHRHARN